MTTHDSAGFEGQLYEVASPSVDYHAPSETYRTEFNFVSRTVSEAVISAVAHVRECDPLDLPPLFQTIDPDALDSVFAPMNGRSRQNEASIEFEYANYTVTVNCHGTVELHLAEEA